MEKLSVGQARLFVIDDLGPEDNAMLQALYSRSAESVEVHLEKVRKAGSGRFMSSYYVGYGHKSIADCGSTTMFLEGVSLLAAKAIQDWPLYSGQETSTRYIDMGKQPIIDPVGTDRSAAILERWMAFYRSKRDRVADHVRKMHPITSDDAPSDYEGAVHARAFDILRGFLPAGITTQLSWHTNLRQAGDHLCLLAHHPSSEIRGLAAGLREILASAYPSSGAGLSLPTVSGVGYEDGSAEREGYHAHTARYASYPSEYKALAPCLPSKEGLWAYRDLLKQRPKGCVLPHFLSDVGTFTFDAVLDFGSFRDLQRHRNGVCRMPLLTTLSFEKWYLEQLDEETRTEARELLVRQNLEIEALPNDPIVRQYYVALGYQIWARVTYALPALVYVMELRSQKTVHPTLRRYVHDMILEFHRWKPDYLTLHVDMDQQNWTVRRGRQTIKEVSRP